MGDLRGTLTGHSSLIVLLAAAVGVYLTHDAFLIYLMSLFMVFSLFALAYNVIMGYLKLVSFGHSLFYAVGAYSVAILSTRYVSDMLVVLPLSVALAAITSLAVGFLTLRHTRIYFAMLTLAFAMLLYALLIKWRDVTGGSDGISGIPRVSALFSLPTTELYYVFLSAVFFISFLTLKRLDGSRLGLILRALGDNEDRFRFLGYNLIWYRIAGLLISGTFSGLAGALYAYLYRAVTPDVAYWTTAAEPLLMVLLGGTGHFLGPLVGAAVFVGLTTAAARVAEVWQLLMGATIVVLLLGGRGGIIGVVERLWRTRY
ncbi:MAG: branched-chain amino acid ABC transporter permease [Nitrososphaerota archaeon]